MRTAFTAAAALAAGLAATPAAATQGQICRPASGTGTSVSFITGAGLAGVSIIEPRYTLSTGGPNARIAVRQSWFDEQRIWIDLTDANATRDEGKLRLAWVGRGTARHLAGTFVRHGRVTRLRCEDN